MKNLLTWMVLCMIAATTTGQEKPKLVVGIVIDQMRMDYIYRYWDKFEDGGFKRLIDQGFLCRNTHFNYIPTYTGPGHASIYTGTTPMNHGIIANTWFDRLSKENVYCSEDSDVNGLGTESDAGKMSPKQMLTPTLGDAIRLASNFKGKSIGISIKDRGATLPAGHSANAAYWMDYKTGNFISSSYYLNELPKWVQTFNKQHHADKLAEEPWTTLYAIDQYSESTADDTPYEKVLNSSGKPVFPYDIQKLIATKSYYALASSPYGNTILRMLAERAIAEEDLGSDAYTDLLAVSFSSPDMIGHAFGPQSIEVEDTYLRLDQEIALLLKALDNRVGTGEYTLFLTADHAAAPVPSYIKHHGMKANYFNTDQFIEGLTNHMHDIFGEGEWIANYSNQQVFLNQDLILEKGLERDQVNNAAESFILSFDGVASTLNVKSLKHPIDNDAFTHAARNGWHPKRSGDLIIQLLPGWMEYSPQGTTHGTSYNYDTHVPLIFFGKGVRNGVNLSPIDITQIASTISALSFITPPMNADNRIIEDAIQTRMID